MGGTISQPAYTGENRCMPCTVVNVVIVLAVAGLLVPFSTALAIAAVVLGILAIYLRGYIVPGTPVLTRRFLPDRMLAWFDKREAVEPLGMDGETVERTLLDAGILVPCTDRSDVCLEPAFRDRWNETLRTLPPPPFVELEPLVGDEDDDSARVETHDPDVTLRVDGRTIGWWPSAAAFQADAAAATLLGDRLPQWPILDFPDRASLLAGLRLWIDHCPDCWGSIELGADTVESCCSTTPVIAVSCVDCGTRLLEIPDY